MAYAFDRHIKREHLTVLRFFVGRSICKFGIFGLAAMTAYLMPPIRTANAADAAPTVADRLRCPLPDIENAEQAAAAISTAFQGVWLRSGDGWISKYELGQSDVRNPLRPDLNVNAPAAKPISGYAYVTGLRCTKSKARRKRDGATPIVIVLVADTLRFNEAGAGWTGSIDDSAVAAAALERTGVIWTARLIRHDDLAVPPDARWQKVAIKDAPPHDTWPARPCEPPKLWSGTTCR